MFLWIAFSHNVHCSHFCSLNTIEEGCFSEGILLNSSLAYRASVKIVNLHL